MFVLIPAQSGFYTGIGENVNIASQFVSAHFIKHTRIPRKSILKLKFNSHPTLNDEMNIFRFNFFETQIAIIQYDCYNQE